MSWIQKKISRVKFISFVRINPDKVNYFFEKFIRYQAVLIKTCVQVSFFFKQKYQLLFQILHVKNPKDFYKIIHLGLFLLLNIDF